MPTTVITNYFPKRTLAQAGTDVAQLAVALEHAVAQFITAVANQAPHVQIKPVRPGGWSQLQIMEHIGIATTLSAGAINAVVAGKPATTLPNGQLTEAGTMVAPEQTNPSAHPTLEHAQHLLTTAVEAINQAAVHAAAAGLANTVCMVNPFFGPLTAIECMRLAVVHVLHHQKQLP